MVFPIYIEYDKLVHFSILLYKFQLDVIKS